MKKFLIFLTAGIVLVTILVLMVEYFKHKTEKSFSPEEEVVFRTGDLKIKVFYNRPYKKGRVIFGGLVPYGKVWRTGANEATVFETNKTIEIEGKKLSPGKYSFWTIPDTTTWVVIFNSQHGQWGINHNGEPNRDAQRDVLTVPVHATQHQKTFEQFTITFEQMGEEAEMILLWDNTAVSIPFSYH
jgi:hypothetical protein